MRIKLEEEAKAAVEDFTAPRIPFSDLGFGAGEPAPEVHTSLRELRKGVEVHAISRTLERVGWNRRRAARLLCISYRGLLYKIRQYNISPGNVGAASAPENVQQKSSKV